MIENRDTVITFSAVGSADRSKYLTSFAKLLVLKLFLPYDSPEILYILKLKVLVFPKLIFV